MLRAAEQAGVKHAYAATHRYAAAMAYTKDLIQSGAIGRLMQVEYEARGYWEVTGPSNWMLHLSQGGGALYNDFPHSLAQILRVTGGKVTRAAGIVTERLERVPAGEPVHDFRDFLNANLQLDQVTEWVPSDADLGSYILMEVTLPGQQCCHVLYNESWKMYGKYRNQAIYAGTEGSIVLQEPWSAKTLTLYSSSLPNGEERIVPQAYHDALPPVEDHPQKHWNQLFRDFVADVRGNGDAGYPTFLDGWMANEIIDITRAGQGWKDIPAHP